MDLDFVSVYKNAKRERGQYPAILTELAWSIKDLLYGIKSTEKMIFVLVYFRALKRKPVIYKSDNAFRFSSSIPTNRSQKILLLSRKVFCERKVSCTRLNFGEILFAGTKRAIPGGRYRSILPARVANQNTEFAAYCPLAEFAIYWIILTNQKDNSKSTLCKNQSNSRMT